MDHKRCVQSLVQASVVLNMCVRLHPPDWQKGSDVGEEMPGGGVVEWWLRWDIGPWALDILAITPSCDLSFPLFLEGWKKLYSPASPRVKTPRGVWDEREINNV